MEIKSRDLSLIAVFASLYAALVYLFAPISFYALQFRIAGVLRPAIARKWYLDSCTPSVCDLESCIEPCA